MIVADASFLIDYLHGVQEAGEYLAEHRDEGFVFPVPAYAETLVGIANQNRDVEKVRKRLRWGEVYTVDKEMADVATEIAAEITDQGPHLSGMDALIAATGRMLDAPVVSADSDLTHEETQKVIEVETYK